MIENVLQVFQYEDARIRTVIKDGEPYFVAADIADALGYGNSRDAISRHCKGVVKHDTPTASGVQSMVVIPERDVYRLIMRSKLPAAEKFEEWVVGEVLPSIRKSGAYQLDVEPPEMQMARGLIAAQKIIDELQPKADALDRISTADGSLCLRDAAKALQTPPHKFNQSLQAAGWIYRRPGKGSFIAYQNRIQAGYLVHKVYPITLSDGSERISEQVRVTPKGLAKLAEMMGKSHLRAA